MPKARFNNLPDEKRERVLRTATQLFAERGFNRADMDEIAKRSGVAKGSLYNYCPSRGLGEKPSPSGEDFSMLAVWKSTVNPAIPFTI